MLIPLDKLCPIPVSTSWTNNIYPGKSEHHTRYLRRGWSSPESDGAWASDHKVRCIFSSGFPSACQLKITARALSDFPDKPQIMTIDIDGTTIDSFVLKAKLQDFSCEIPANKPGMHVMTMSFTRLDRPFMLDLGPDNRRLAARIKSISFKPCSQPLFDPEEIWIVPAMGTLSIPFIPGGSGTIQLILEPEQKNSAVTIRVEAEESKILAEVAYPKLKHRKRFKKKLNLNSDTLIRIFLENPSSANLSVRGTWSPMLIPSSSCTTLTDVNQENPDLDQYITAVLDACNPEFLGCYGNPEACTPFIDHLSQQGSLFTEMFSTASYTVTSVAGMMTGELPGVHGVTQVGHSIKLPANTVATRFANAGYHSAGFSAMPTVSSKWNMHIGFHEFDELYKQSPDPLSAESMTEAALSSLKKQTHAFHYFHYREPHAPYSPPPPFNLLYGATDPEVGSIPYLESLDKNMDQCNTATLRQIKNLYLGQLAFADRELARIFEYLQQNETLKSWKFMLTSDHGEAFGRHNRLTHNSTVFADMTQVPCIIYEWPNPKGQLITGKFSNRDMGEILISSKPKPKASIWHRSSGTTHFLEALQWRNWHLIRGGYYPVLELFNTESDPGESTNCSRLNPVQTDYLISKMNELNSQTLNKDSSSSEMNTDLQDQLRALGYLN